MSDITARPGRSRLFDAAVGLRLRLTPTDSKRLPGYETGTAE